MLSLKEEKQVHTREAKKLQELHWDLKTMPKGRINLHVNRNFGAAIVSVRTIILSDDNRVTAITGSFSLGNLHKSEDNLFRSHSSLSTDSSSGAHTTALGKARQNQNPWSKLPFLKTDPNTGHKLITPDFFFFFEILKPIQS